MKLYFVHTLDTHFKDFCVLANNKDDANLAVLKHFNGRCAIDKSKTRLVPHGHYLVSETFLNAEV